MESKQKRMLIFCLIISIPMSLLMINILWSLSLEKGDPLLKTANFINLSLMLLIPLIGFINYAIDKKFELSKGNGKGKKVSFSDFTKTEKFIGLLLVVGAIFVSLSIFVGEYFLLFLGTNITTNVLIIFEYIGYALLIISAILLLL